MTKMADTLTFDQEEAAVRGQIPLNEFREILKKQDESQITKIDFSRNGYCNDAVLKLIQTEKKKPYTNLTDIWLDGCILLTNAGIKWLSEIVQGADQLKVIYLDGCINLADDDISLLFKNTTKECVISMVGTSVTYVDNPEERKRDGLLGCPKVTGSKTEEKKCGHILVVPHESVENSLVEFVKEKKVKKRQHFHHQPNLEINEWMLTLSELSIEHPLFDAMVTSHPIQVVIPFGESAVIKEVKTHVTDTVAKVISKAAFTVEYPKNVYVTEELKVVDIEVDDFITVQNVGMQHYNFKEGIVGNYCYKDELLGAFLSRTPLTRSNPYFEVELVQNKVLDETGSEIPNDDGDSDDDGEESKSGILIGCLFNELFNSANCLEVDVEKGGEVATFDFKKCTRAGFGIRGNWFSEYIPDPSSARFFAVRDGIEDNKDLTGTSVLQEMLYPLIAVIGEQKHSAKVRICNMAQPPEELMKKWEEENRWISLAFVENILVDKNGIMSNCSKNEDEGIFMSMETVDQSFSVKVLDKGNFGKIRIGIAKERKDGDGTELPKKECWVFQGVTGEIVAEKKTTYTSTPGRVEDGDVLTVKLITEDQEEKIFLFKNDKKIAETPFSQEKDDGKGIYRLHIFIAETKVRLQLMNYRPRYLGPIMFPESLTVGRLHNLIITDDGLISGKKETQYNSAANKNTFRGCYMGKSAMNSQCLSFEVTIEAEIAADKNSVAIGFCHSELRQLFVKKKGTEFKISGGCVVYSNIGQIFAETSVPTGDKKNFKNGDKVKCEIEKVPTADKLLFDDDGSLSSQQDVNIKFFINDEMVEQYTMKLLSDGIYPAVFTHQDISKITDPVLKIHNFYPETEENRKRANLQKSEKKKKTEKENKSSEKKEIEPCLEFRDCEFIVVEVGKTAGKLQLIEEQLKGDMFTSTIENINKSIDFYEKNFKDLDIHGQNVYSTLCQTKDKMEDFMKKPSRIKYMVMDLTTGQGLDKVLDRVTSGLDCRMQHQIIRYGLTNDSSKIMALVKTTVEKEKIIDFEAGMRFSDKDRTLVKSKGREFLQLAKHLHEQGEVVVIQLNGRTVIADINFLASVLEKMEKMSTMQLSGKLSTAINESSHVWTTESAIAHFIGQDENLKEKTSLLMEILQDYFGLIEIPAWRQKTDDTQFLYTTLDSLSSPPIPLREFWSKGDRTKDMVVMQRTYSFVHTISDHILASVLSSATRYGRTLLMTSEGAAFQIGCVQTVVTKHRGLMDLVYTELQPIFDNQVISIESKCYIPDQKTGPVDDLTEVYVQEYTWNIFCLYTDIMEKILKQHNIVYLESGESPKEFVNVSVGCKHNWKQIPGKANQSVCTMCNKCCDQGRKCPYNGIMGDNLKECLCKTNSPGCIDCGICADCAKELWTLRSYLRPLPLTAKDPEKKTVVKPQDLSSTTQKKLSPEETNNVFVNIPLDPVAFNEIECQHLSGGKLGFILKDIDDGSRISVFPGQATTLSADIDDKKIVEKVKYLDTKQGAGQLLKNQPEQILKFRITDPYKSITKEPDKLDVAGIQESRVVYHACINKEITVSHETGLLCYNSASASVPVAQFIGPRPFSEKLKKLTIKIIDCGEKTNVGIGICPGKTYPVNRMPGWNRWSIAYHADDGGIFIEAGFANSHVVKCTKGDTMSLFCDVVSRQLVFYKNDQEVKQIKINVPRGGYWPMIGLHSVGECVKILDKEAWTPEPDDIPPKPSAFNTYKYGNLWISPARNVSLTTRHTSRFGWVILHNPTQVVIGYKITPEDLVKDPIGIISPHDAIPLFLKLQTSRKVDTVTVSWIAIEQVKEYTTDQIIQLFNAASSTSTYTHKLGLLSKDTTLGESETLAKFDDSRQESEMTQGGITKTIRPDGFKLDVIKNSILVESYLLKRGRYLLDIVDLDKTPKPEYIIRRLKCPSFLYPSSLQKGLKVVVKLDSVNGEDRFADAVLSEVYEGSGYCMEYTPQTGNALGNEKICISSEECGIDEEDWSKIELKGSKEDMTILLFSSPSNQSNLAKTYVPAPPYLVTKGSAEVLEMIDPEWKKNALISFTNCSQSITRPTIQEQIVTKHSRRLLKWLSYRDSNLPYSVILLPASLDATTLKYPLAKNMFGDVSVHRLCFFQDAYIDMSKMPMVYPSKLKKYPLVRSLYDDVNIHAIAIHDPKEEKTYPLKQPREVCLHMMDIPGFKVNGKIPVDISYGCLYQAWTYVALLTHKLLLPAYTKIFTGELGDLNRQQIENLLFQLIQPYASLCSIYSAQYGGLSNQENPTYLSEKIREMCDEKVQPIPKQLLGKGMISDNHTFVSFPPFLACKSHSHSRVDRNIVRIPDLSLEAQYYEPYSEKMDILMINEQKLNSLPQNLFNIFENLQVMIIMNVELQETQEFPSGISRCHDLEIVCLSGLPGVKKMAKDILSAPALSTFYLHNLPIKRLDIDWPASTTLTSLTLKGLRITEIPKEISKLAELQELNLDCNPILTLPDELENLKKLKHLSAKGIPWIAFEGKFEQMPKQIYNNWHIENPYIVNYLSKKAVDDLFHRFDDNNNNILDATEVAKLNFEFLTTIPRIGVQKLGDTVHGGVPEVVFKLKGLESLDLSYTGVNCIPDLASELFTLQTLNLEHCPFLESVSGNIGLLPNLRSLHLNSCPLLETPPPDIVGRGFDSIRAFLKKMAGGFTECHRTKLMFIGLGQAGKTTLLQALKSPTKKTQGTQNAQLTDGIEIKPWDVPVDHDGKQYNITYSCWDFAGQTVYYNTHQFFLSKQAVYMLLWNMRMGFEHAGLDFWLSSVACHCPNAPVVVVGTQLDQIPMPDIPEKELMRKYPQIKKFCYVSSTAGTNIEELEKTLIDVTLNYCSQMKLKIPQVWLNFEECILVERKRGKNILEWDKLKQYAIDNGIYDEKDIRLAVQFLDDLGTVQYFDTEILRDRVVINPQWIVDVMAKVVSVNEKYIKESKGRFFHKFIGEIWKDYDESLHEWMLKLTERFDLTFPLPESTEPVNVVPCLLPEEEPEDLPWPKIEEEAGIRESKIQYKFTYLPTGLFNRAQARLFSQGFTDVHLLEYLWKKGSILKKNNHYALVKQVSDYEMIVTVQGPRPKNILDLIHETISTLIKDSFQGVDYDFYIPCPDCVEKEGTRDPFLFKADLISRAHNVNAPFLQCTKYFHTVSIGELLSIMPDNRETEFDVQIQESISTLQEISSNMAKDVAILYSPEDLPTRDNEGELVSPKQLGLDLRLSGLRCYFPKDVDNVNHLEMTLAIKNAKVLVVCMSDRFVRHPICRQMFLYASEQLYKPYAIGVIDEGTEWQASDLCFKIGNPKMAMIKNMKRYKKKMEDLIDIIRSHILDIERNIVSYPSVFISYCWVNSADACSVTTEAKEGSLGFGDPRAVKKYLEKKGLHCWIDVEQMGKLGLYQDITVGLQNCKVLVICVSDELARTNVQRAMFMTLGSASASAKTLAWLVECRYQVLGCSYLYLQSDACMMEARFGAYNLQMPIVVCVVGTGKAWKMSEVSLMIQKAGDSSAVVKMQKENKEYCVYEQAYQCVNDFVNRPETEKQKRVREKLAKVQFKKEQLKNEEIERKLKQQGDSRTSFQEEVELIQRKFMRHIFKITRTDDLEHELPKLLVFDFLKKASTQKKQDHSDDTRESRMTEERPSTSQSLRPRTSKKAQSRDKMKAVTLEELEDDWQGEDFCIRVLCEDEQGWHLAEEKLSLISNTSEEIYKALKDAAPYLARIYAILKQSAIPLNCLASKMGENFLNYIRKEGIGTKNFSDGYNVVRKLVAESEEKDEFIGSMNRCYLQSGKISWLCSKHHGKAGITQLQSGTSSIHGTARVLIFEEDTLLKDLILASPLYLERIRERTNFDFKKEKSSMSKDQVIKKEKSDVVKKTLEKKDEPIVNGIEEEKRDKKKSDKTVRISENPNAGPSNKSSTSNSMTNEESKKNISFKTVGAIAEGVTSANKKKTNKAPLSKPESRSPSASSSTADSNSSAPSSRSTTKRSSMRKQKSQACTIQ